MAERHDAASEGRKSAAVLTAKRFPNARGRGALRKQIDRKRELFHRSIAERGGGGPKSPWKKKTFCYPRKLILEGGGQVRTDEVPGREKGKVQKAGQQGRQEDAKSSGGN